MLQDYLIKKLLTPQTFMVIVIVMVMVMAVVITKIMLSF